MAPHWKCGSGQPVAGSNPALSATTRPRLTTCDGTPRDHATGARDVSVSGSGVGGSDRGGHGLCRPASGGVFLFDTGFGFGNAELDEVYRPTPKRIADALAEAGIAIEDVTAVANC